MTTNASVRTSRDLRREEQREPCERLGSDDAICAGRLELLRLARELGSVAEACRRGGVTRQTYYKWKSRFEAAGLEGLKDRPSAPTRRPHALAPGVGDEVAAAALEHPAWGCGRLAEVLRRRGVRVSAPTAQALLSRRGLGARGERAAAVEERALREGLLLPEEHCRLIEHYNPAFRERHAESAGPGRLLAQETLPAGRLPGVGQLHAQVVVDTCGAFAFARLHRGRTAVAAVEVLTHDVLPFYDRRGGGVEAIVTGWGREFWGPAVHPYREFLAARGIEHRRPSERPPRQNGFVARFGQTLAAELFRTEGWRAGGGTFDDRQAELEGWLERYNARPLPGYRNLGEPPAAFLARFAGPEAEVPSAGFLNCEEDHRFHGAFTGP